MKPSISWNNNMLNPNTTLNENTETGDVPENLKIEAPELYETPDYTLPNEPSSYERKGFGFDQSNANKEDFIKYVYASRLIRERGGDEMLRRGGVMNCLYSINNMYRYIPANEAYREFFGGDIPIDQAEAELDRLYDIAANSEDALGKFLKLDDARQEKIIRQNVQGGRVKKAYTATGSSGGAIVADIDNPDFDMGKGREEYENILRAKNTWEGYLQLRNNFSPEVVRDAMRFKTATAESRSNVAEAVLIKMREKGPEYRAAFLASLDVLGVNIKDASDHNFFERAFTRISEAWTDSGVNMADKFWYSRTDGRVLYGMAEEMGLIDESGNLTEDASKLGKLKQAYEDSQNTAAIRALGSAGGWGLGSAGGWGSKLAYKDTEIQKLFDEGKENIETRRMYRNLRANLATQYNYSGDEWKTLEDMFVYGEYTLRAIGVSAATLAATKNPFMASLASVPMMFAEETARMYSELRLDAGLTESQASLLAMQYGVAVSAAEQFQLGRFMGSFVGKSAAKSFKEYVFNNFKGGVKKAIKESALETGVELSQNTYDLSTKIFATEAFGAGFNTDQLLDNYVEDFKSAALITPLITTFIFGVGAPFRFSGTLSNVGANYGTVAKAIVGIKPSEVVENNVETFETIRAAGEYEALVKSKYGATEQGRDFLLKYLNAKDSVERNSILQKRFPDAKERAEAKLFLENFKRLDSEAFDSILKVKIEAAQKREAEAQSILKGDTTDISALDAETTDEAGNISYEILNSAIDALGMRDDVVFVNNAQELAQASGMSLNAAEDVISRKGAKGFFDEKNGKIVIIKSHFASGADALQSFAHEYGHKIMAKIRANDLNGYKRMCSDVLDLIGGEAVARASLPASYSQVGHANYAKDSLDVAEESLMRVLEQVALKRVLDARKKSVWARFKGWFQKLFSEKSLADITNERLAQIALDVLQKEKSFNVSVSNAPSRNWRAKTPEADGEYVSGEWEVVDAGDLKTSLDAGYDDALQPRNRGRQSSKEQVLNIANNLDPELLDNDPRTSDGAPIVDSRSMAVSGNGRILAIRQAYESGKAEEYRRHVLSRANSMGIDVPAGIKNPVLIRRVMDTGNMSIEELAARSNKSSVAGMSVAEQAVADGRRISEAGLLDIFFPGADGNILAESNRDFNNAFLNLVGGSETFRNKDGSLRTNLSPRVRAAVLAAMLNTGGNRDIVERLLDNPEGYNALINGLMQCAANLAELAQKPQYDISGELSQAVELYIEMHDKGQTVAEFEAQPDMFREQPSAEVMFLCRLFENNQKTPSGISGVLKEYAAQCKKIDTTTADLFGEEDPSKLDKLQAAYDHYATDLAQSMDNLRALDRGNPAYANFDERKLNDKETLKNLTPEEILERIKSVKSVSFPVERLDENFNLKYYWNWFEKNLLDREIPTVIRRNAVFKKGHFFKLIAGGKNKGFIKGYTTPEDAFKAIKKGKVLLHDKDLAPEGFSMVRARQMPLVLDVLQDPFFVLKDKKTKDFIFLKKYEGGGNYVAVMFNANPLGIVSWQMRDFTLSNARRSTLEYQKNGVDFLAQPRESSMRDNSPKTLSESENNSENQENSSKKWREVSEPSPEEIAEANRQKAEVKAKWTNPDGSMKKGYMLAPNGKPTNLTENQWLQVRTPNFKKWFGDWEKEAWAKAAMDFLQRTAPVANLTGQEFQKDGVRLTDKVSAYFNSIGNVAHNEELGDVILDKDTVKASMSHGIGRLKASAFMAVKDVIENGFIFNRESNWKGRGYDTAVIVAPIKIGGESYTCEVVVKKSDKRNSFYLHEVEIKETLEDMFKTTTEGAISQASKLIIGKHIAEVKENVSKVVDENGEPMVMYHGTEWNPLAEKSGNAAFKDESYFTDKKDYANRYKKDGKIYEFYLNLKKPFDTRNSKEKEIFEREFYRKWGNGAPLTERGLPDWTDGSDLLEFIREKGYDYDGIILDEGADGGYGKNVSYRGESYVPINSTQIKSATDNAGTFNPENPDIRWREADSEVKRAVDEWASNPENVRKLAEEYLAGQKGQIVVDPDRIRAKLPNYEVSLNSDFVEAGDKVLEEVWKESLKRAPKDKPVVLLTGNPAAGKGTAKETGLLDWVVEANLVFDAPQNKFTSVEKRVKEAVNAGHSVRIIQIYNDPITSWRNSLKRGIGKDNPKTGMREGGRFLPMEYFVGVYESAQGKVEKIETILKQKYQNKLETKYIDSTGNNPIVVSPDEAKAWDYSISDNQLKEIERITDEYRGRIEESARLRGDKKDPLAVIGRGVSQSLAISVRGSTEKISRRTESGDERAKQSLPGEGGEGRGPVSRLKALLRQERSENPVIWASIVLAREILLGRPITSAKIDKVLPPDKFDGTKRQYALDRAKHIAEHCKATQKNYANRIDEAVKLAEIDVYWKHDVMEEMYRSYRKDGEEYGIAKQKLLDWIKNEQRKDLEKVKGFSSDELGIDVPAEIENALQEEPVRKKAEESQSETEDKEEIESIAEDGIDDEILGTREKLAPSSLRGIVDKIRIAVTKKVKARGGDEQTRRRVYRNTLVEVLSESAKELSYGRERELIQQNIRGLGNLAYHNVNSLKARAIELKNKRDLAEKDKSLKSDYIETYNNIQGIYFGTYSGRGGVMNYFVKNYLDNPSQIPDPYSIYAEHIALRIFNRGVRDSKAQLLERFGGIIKRKGKKPSRMERDDKRKMAGAVQMRIYKIGKFAEMDAAELEAEYFAAVDKLNNAGVHFAGDSDNGETNKDFTDIEDIRAEAANTIADIQRFGNLREKSRADMAGAVEFLEKHIEEEMQKQEELIAKKKEEAAKKRKVVSDALRMSKHNAHKDGALRSGGRALINKTMPFDSLLAVLGEYATGETFLAFDAWRKDLVARIDRAAALVANETFRAQERLINIVEECYSENFSDALKRLLKLDPKYEEFSNLGGESEGMKQPMSLANVLQLYASALQENYRQNVYAHRAKKNGDVEKLQMKIDEILESYPDRESKKGEGWKSASEEIKSLENRIVGLQKNAVSDYIERIEKVLTDADKKFVELLRKEYADALPALSAVSRRVIGLPIEQADALYIPAKIKREKTFGEAAGQVPVVPKILSPRVQHMRDFDETANPISLYLDRVRENAQFKYFSELYIEMRSIFGSEELQDLISQRCGSNTLQELLDFVVDISTGQTRGYKDEYIQKANGLFALVALGFNLGSGVRQILPGCFSWGTYIGTPSVLKNMAAFFTPEGFSAALEIWRSENGRRRFSIGNLQIMEEMLATPDQNKFWALFKRYALVFNRASDMLAISFVGQGVYRAGVENYLRQGFNEAKAKEKAMADMWQIAERTQASGRMHNMARWQRRGGDLGKGIGMFSAPPQLMFSKSAQDIRRAIALGIKTPEGRVAAWQALKTWATVSILVEGSYAASGVLWNALLKGFFDDDDDERIIKQMATGPFGGLFLFGRMIENSTSNRGIESIMPVAGLARPAGNIYDLTLDLMTFDLDKALEDLDKLGKSTVPLYRDFRKVIDNRILEEN